MRRGSSKDVTVLPACGVHLNAAVLPATSSIPVVAQSAYCREVVNVLGERTCIHSDVIAEQLFQRSVFKGQASQEAILDNRGHERLQ